MQNPNVQFQKMNETAKSNESQKHWPGTDLILHFKPHFFIYLVAAVVAITAVLITILINKTSICKTVGKVIPGQIWYILFGSLCALVEFYLISNLLINPAEVI